MIFSTKTSSRRVCKLKSEWVHNVTYNYRVRIRLDPGNSGTLPIMRGTNIRFCKISRGVLAFLNFLQKFTECRVLWSLYFLFFYAFPLKLHIQSLLSAVLSRSVFWRTTKFQQNDYTPENYMKFIKL